MKLDYKKYLPHAAAIVVFAILTLIYFKPLLSGKILKQHDIAMHKGMSKEIMDYREQKGSEPLWTNSMFGGMPAYLVSTLHTGNYLPGLDRVFKLFLPLPGGYFFLYFLGFFILLLCLDVNAWLATVGAIAYGLSSYFLIILQAGHNSKAHALGYLPALIGGVILLFKERYWLGLSLTALFTALELNAGHVQITYYGYMMIGFLILGYFITSIKEKHLPVFLKSFAIFLIACLLGLLPNAGNLLTTNEYGKLSLRGKAELTINPDMSSNKNILSGGLDKDYATGWSYGIGETFSFLIPDFKGGGDNAIGRVDPSALKKVDPEFREMVGSSNVYFGDQPGTSGPVYLGAIVFLLAIIGMFIVKHPIKWPLIAVTFLTIALGWGHNFMSLTSFFMDYVPGYNKFRAVSMIMIVSELTFPLFAILGINELIKIKNWNEKYHLSLFKKDITYKKLIIIVTSVVGGFCLICYLAPDLVNTFQSSGEYGKTVGQYVRAGYPEDQAKTAIAQLMPQLEIARKAIFKSDAIRSVIFILLGFVALYLYFTNKIKKEVFFVSLGLFIFIDLWSVDRRYLNDKSFITKAENNEYVAGKTRADEEILLDKDLDYRVLNLTLGTFDDASTSYYHKSIGGYHGAKLRRYQDLIDFHVKPEINLLYKDLSKASANDSSMSAMLGRLGVINMLNTKYFILPAGEDGNSAVPLKNPVANGNAWFIKSLKTVVSPDSEIVALKRIDTKSQAIVNEQYKSDFASKENYNGEGSIKLISYEPNDLVYETDTKAEEFAVFSEIYYKYGWNAYVDGQLKSHIPVNYVLRGMNVPPGKHKIEFKFEPKTYYTGNTIAMLGSILLFLTVGFGLFKHSRNKVIVS
ncbi:YfhO family protein [Aurantibacillus circumpalustris]|uniref:YfhO family protein n=1 Tax=Aurantibacillus circumpalustris TaxID=3036359 RepID=UPI00295A8787|nr:YfhO family protein [Aurantibacillus circumpalustris]